MEYLECSSAIVGGLATGAVSGANQYTGPAHGTKKCFIAAAAAGDITTTVNKGRRAGPMSSLLLLDVYGSCIERILTNMLTHYFFSVIKQ